MTKPIDKPPSKETPADLRSRAEAALENGDLVAAKELAGRLSALPLGPWDNTVLGRIALADGDHPAARTALEAALKQLPDEGSILVHLAEVCAVQKRWGEAVKTITIAIAQRGSIAELHERRAIYLANTGDQIESIDALERALGLEPDRASAWALLGERYIEQKNSQAAKKAFETAVKSDPTNHSGLWNLALLAEQEGDLEKAVDILTRQIDATADNRHGLHRRGLIRLSLGDLDRGWEDYAARRRSPAYRSWQHALSAPYWMGEDLTDKHLAIWADQGIGEQILTAGMAHQADSRAGSLSLACDPRLVALLSRSFPDIAVVSLEKLGEQGEAIGPVDTQASVSELGAVLRPTMDSFPPAAAYLVADDKRVTGYREDLSDGDADRPLVGISWRSENVIAGKEKSTDLVRHWSAVLNVPSVRFVSLQYGDTDAEIAAARAKTGVDIVTVQDLDPTKDIDGFAALVAAMDFVVSTSNTTVHVAGGLAKPTLAMIPRAYGRPWYWFDKGETSPWYSNLTLLRSKGDWSEVAEEAARHLAKWLNP